jgi:hypothetical protein
MGWVGVRLAGQYSSDNPKYLIALKCNHVALIALFVIGLHHVTNICGYIVIVDKQYRCP